MAGITLKNGFISYYGNPAGYTEKEKAVVDSIFQSDELTAWLMKIPPKIRVFSFAMLMCFLMTYMAIIVYEIITSLGGMF